MSHSPDKDSVVRRQRASLARIAADTNLDRCVPWLGRISVPPGIAHPKIDSLLLALTATPWVRGAVLDTFCGSGVIGLHLLNRAERLSFVDVNPACIDFIRPHAALAAPGKHIETIVADVYPDTSQTFHLIVANPPYTSEKSETMEDRIVFDDQHRAVTRFVENLPRHLAPDGCAFMTWPSYSDFQMIEALFRRSTLNFYTQAELREPWPNTPETEVLYRVYRLERPRRRFGP